MSSESLNTEEMVKRPAPLIPLKDFVKSDIQALLKCAFEQFDEGCVTTEQTVVQRTVFIPKGFGTKEFVKETVDKLMSNILKGVMKYSDENNFVHICYDMDCNFLRENDKHYCFDFSISWSLSDTINNPFDYSEEDFDADFTEDEEEDEDE